MQAALPIEQHDDRFDRWPRAGSSSDDNPTGPATYRAALAMLGRQPVGFLGGDLADTMDGGALSLDALIVSDVDDPAALLDRLYQSLIDAPDVRAALGSDHAIEVWGRPAAPWHETLAKRHGLTELRALHQMRCPLPAAIEPISSRPFDPERDLEALQSVNNRAFAAHPDQGHQSLDDLLATMAEPWFRPEGLRIHERDGRVAGFCWTKIHAARREIDRQLHSEADDEDDAHTGDTRLGEIYVIGVDPDFHGQGLGAPMTAAGLHWLAEQGLTTGMLYVEADNVPAIRTYEKLGFFILRTDRAWHRVGVER